MPHPAVHPLSPPPNGPKPPLPYIRVDTLHRFTDKQQKTPDFFCTHARAYTHTILTNRRGEEEAPPIKAAYRGALGGAQRNRGREHATAPPLLPLPFSYTTARACLSHTLGGGLPFFQGTSPPLFTSQIPSSFTLSPPPPTRATLRPLFALTSPLYATLRHTAFVCARAVRESSPLGGQSFHQSNGGLSLKPPFPPPPLILFPPIVSPPRRIIGCCPGNKQKQPGLGL
jgi:hypothetical protein